MNIISKVVNPPNGCYAQYIRGSILSLPLYILLITGIQSFHYHAIINTYGCCPIPVALGESETGKSTAVMAALALFGCDDIGMSVKMTNAILMERACSAMLPFGIEEGKRASSRSKTNQLDITEVIMDLSNGSSSANMKMGTMRPQTVPLIASNFNIDEMARYRFPMIIIFINQFKLGLCVVKLIKWYSHAILFFVLCD